MSLVLSDVRVQLGERHWRFDTEFPRHGIHAILGRSGSGKSTLLNLVGGYLQAASGTIHWESTLLDPLPPSERPVNTLFQSDNLFAHLSVADNIGLGLDPRLKLSASQRTQIEDALRDIGMPGFGKRKPGSLSGGERQRVGLARCLLRARPILLLDEPFGALDGNTRADMLALTRDLIARIKPCVLMVTHDADDADAIGADIVEIAEGSVRWQTAQRRPQTP